MIEASFCKYKSYDDFLRDFLITVMEEDHAAIICKWQDVQGVLASIHTKVINGSSFVLDTESAYCFDEEILTAQMNDGNMIITIFSNGLVVCEPALYTNDPISFVQCKYFVEYDAASALEYAIISPIIPFKIEEKIKL